jgi:hypothetical protein
MLQGLLYGFPYLKGFGFHEVKMNFYDFMVICL